ncbi:uncharacterized protein [Amphiura filiformis]|uniref:uncharacterized protein n=1 Tax=Amphiura filiformis TaxID=82378 RepID=UPI003B217B9B
MNVPQEQKEDNRQSLGIPKVEAGNSPFSGFSVRKLKIGSILAFLERLGLEDTKNQLVKVIQSVKDLVSNKPCVLPETLTDEQLKMELQERGINASGSREVLITRYKQPEDLKPP